MHDIPSIKVWCMMRMSLQSPHCFSGRASQRLHDHWYHMALKNYHILTLFLLHWHHYVCFTYCIPFHLRMAFFSGFLCLIYLIKNALPNLSILHDVIAFVILKSSIAFTPVCTWYMLNVPACMHACEYDFYIKHVQSSCCKFMVFWANRFLSWLSFVS